MIRLEMKLKNGLGECQVISVAEGIFLILHSYKKC